MLYILMGLTGRKGRVGSYVASFCWGRPSGGYGAVIVRMIGSASAPPATVDLLAEEPVRKNTVAAFAS